MYASRLWAIAKVLFGIAVLVGVARYFQKTLDNPDLSLNCDRIRWPLLLPAGLLYLLCHTLWGTFWWQLLRQQNHPCPWPRAISAYFISQFGKYVPGKAWVIVVRVAMLGRGRASRRVVAVTGIFETLTSMAAGALLGIAALPMAGLALPPEMGSVGLFALIGGVPVAVALLLKIAQKVTRRDALPTPSFLLLLRGLGQDAFGWLLLALSLQLTIAAVQGGEVVLTPDALLASLAAVALSYVAGFVVLVAPGGLGVREWVLAYIVARRFTGEAATAEAMVVALVLRLAWTSAEILVASTLWLAARRRHDD